MSIDITRGAPEDLLGLTLSELWDAVRAIETWTPRHAHVLDYVYRHLTLRCVSSDANTDDVSALYEHLIRVAGEVPDSLSEARLSHNVDPPWRDQWRAYADVVDSRLAVLRAEEYAPTQAPDAERVLTHAHVGDILREIREQPGIPQGLLGEKLGLGIDKIRRIVNLMVAVGLVQRRSIDKENALHPGPAAPDSAPIVRLSTVELLEQKGHTVRPKSNPRIAA